MATLVVAAILPAVTSIAVGEDQQQQYRVWVVNQSSPHATDGGPATAANPFRTISAAAAAANAGDTVVVGSGVYRERVSPARGGAPGRPITYTAAPGAHPVIRGSMLVAPSLWRPAAEPHTGGGHADEAAGTTTFRLELGGHPEWFEMINGGRFNPFAIRLGWPVQPPNPAALNS